MSKTTATHADNTDWDDPVETGNTKRPLDKNGLADKVKDVAVKTIESGKVNEEDEEFILSLTEEELELALESLTIEQLTSLTEAKFMRDVKKGSAIGTTSGAVTGAVTGAAYGGMVGGPAGAAVGAAGGAVAGAVQGAVGGAAAGAIHNGVTKAGKGIANAARKVFGKKKSAAVKAKVNEEVTALFSTVEGLSEDFSTKATGLFEESLDVRVELLRESIEAEYASKLDEEVQDIAEQFQNRLDDYLNYVVESFMKTNALAIDRGITQDIAEQVMASVATIIESAGVVLPEEKIDIAEALTAELAEAEKNTNNVIEENISLKHVIRDYEIKEVIAESAKNLSDAGKDKLVRLAEDVKFTTKEEYASKIAVLVEGIVPSKPVETAVEINEGVTLISEETKPASSNPRMAEYLKYARG